LAALLERERRLREQGETKEIVRVYCGYSGWGESQLDGELKTGSWIVQPASADLIFSEPAETLWARAMERQGGIFRIFSLMPPDPEMN
ncbi:MAG: YqgE/AlgH family protein, partial [Planctomycetes bacterium]|nr:YqgE/AlgH family protein [Planctomycetota bacterium]